MRSTGPIAVAALLLLTAAVPAPARAIQYQFEGCSPQERKMVREAVEDARRLAEAAVGAVRRPDRNEAARRGRWDAYRAWFGEYSDARFARVASVLVKVSGGLLSNDRFRLLCGARALHCSAPAPTIEEDDLAYYGAQRAYSEHGLKEIGLCPAFFDEGRRTRASVVFHELTHITDNTQDHEYGEDHSRELAEYHPELAVENADSYLHFAKSLR